MAFLGKYHHHDYKQAIEQKENLLYFSSGFQMSIANPLKKITRGEIIIFRFSLIMLRVNIVISFLYKKARGWMCRYTFNTVTRYRNNSKKEFDFRVSV